MAVQISKHPFVCAGCGATVQPGVMHVRTGEAWTPPESRERVCWKCSCEQASGGKKAPSGKLDFEGK